MAKNGFRAFDSDMHVYDAPDLYVRYMNPVWGERIPVAEGWTRHGRPQFKIGGTRLLRPRRQLLEYGEQLVESRYGFALQRNYDAVSQIQAMDMEGLDVAVLFRTSPLHCDETFEAQYANDLCRAWNDWIADFCKASPKRLKASALITLHDVDLAVDEVRRAVNELGAVGLSLCPEPINGKRIHDRLFDPLWAEIEKLGVALCFHPPARPNQDQVANKFYDHPNGNIIGLALRNPVELILAVSSFCAGGVLEKFPKLRVAFLEGNCAWLPWLLYRLDERAKLHGPLADVPLSKKPSDYFLQQCFVSVDPDEYLVVDVVKRIGDDNIVISTDYPHIDAHFPHALDEFLEIEDLPDSSRRKILWDNCVRLYGVNDADV
ncbi:MAG TPA: amidohydrolase family protein [candidate division Zixibacteria bacterium]|nr:amidohydrolase family protein [candidate division Zixibacteria bacterium]